MIIPIHYEPEVCVSTRKDAQQSYQGHVYLDAKKSRLYAANGRVAIAIDVVCSAEDVSGPIPSEVFPNARMRVKKDGGGDMVTIVCLKDTLIVRVNDVDVISYLRPKPTDGRKTNFAAIIKSADQKPLGEGMIDPLFGVDVDDLSKLKKALGSKTLRVEVTPAALPLKVYAEARSGARAIVMRAAVEAPRASDPSGDDADSDSPTEPTPQPDLFGQFADLEGKDDDSAE